MVMIRLSGTFSFLFACWPTGSISFILSDVMTSLPYCTQTRLVGEQEYVFHRNDTVPDMDGPWYMRVSGLLLYIYNPS
jgi:hypothetical protein